MSIQELNSGTIRLISSTVNIYSVYSVVKELVENSIDANGQNIVVRLEKNGSSRIEVRDNGSGITKSNALLVGRANHTSKIGDYSDLDRLGSYGFRGQAINSLCAVADVSFTTRSKEDEYALTYTLNEEGKSVSSKPSPHLVGTTVVVENLFARIPVRRKMLSSASSLKSVLRLLRCFGLAKPNLSISLFHDGSAIWRKSSSSSLSSAAQEVMGYKLAVQMQYICWKGSQAPIERVEEEENADVSGDEPVCLEMEVEMLVPKKGINIQEVSSFPSPEGYIPNVYLLINGRPVKHKKIDQLMNTWISRGTVGELPKRKKPAWVLKLELPPDKIDVNLEADKTKVLLRAEDVLITRLEEILSEYYLIFSSNENVPVAPPKTSVISSQKPREAGKQSEDKTLSESQEESQMLSSEENFPDASRKVPNSRKTMRDFSPSEELPTKQRKVSEEEVIEINNAEKNDRDDNPPSPAPSLSQILNVDNFVQQLNSKNQPDKDEDIIEIRIPILPVNDDEIDAGKDPEEVEGSSELRDTEVCTDILDQEWDSQLLRVEEVGVGVEESSKNAPLQRLSEAESVEGRKEIGDLVVDNEEVISTHNAENDAFDQLPKIEDWSCGNACVGGTKVLDPVKILLPGKTTSNIIDLTSDSDGEKSKQNRAPTIVIKNSKESSSAGTIKNHHVLNANNILMANSPLPHACSQMGRRDLRGFQEFSTNRRPKILEKNPGMKSSEVAELLAVQWKALSKTEQDIYEKRAQHAVSVRQQKARENSFTPDKNQNMKQQVLTESFTTTPSAPKSRRLSKEPPPLPTIGMVMQVSLELVENAVMKSASRSGQERKTKSGKIHLIGQLKPSRMWVCCKKNKIGILRHFALQEVVVCAKLMESLTIPLSPLPKPIEVNERNLGPVLLGKLLSLERQYDVFTENTWVTSSILSKNGFRIKITLDENEETCGVITDIAAVLPSYGITDLKEILNKNCVQTCKLSDSRPLMVVDYIKSEAVRMCHQSPPVMGKGDLIDLLKNWSEDSLSQCLHAQPIFHVIHTCEFKE